MAGQTEIELEFGDGAYLFALKLPQLAELQRTCDAGVFAIYGRIARGRYLLNGEPHGVPHECEAYVLDVYETIRLGLIGGAKGFVNGQAVEVTPLRARELVETYIHPAPLKEAWDLAAVILMAKIEGYEPPKKAAPAQKPAASGRKASTSRKP